MMTKQYKKYSELFDQYMTFDEKAHLDHSISQDEIDSFMENIRNEATKLLGRVTDDKIRERIEKLIESCNNSSYSHRIYIENKQLIILETKDTGKKYVMIKSDIIGNNRYYIDACDYDDVIKKGKEVLANEYLVKIKVSLPIAIKAGQLVEQVRRDNGKSTLFYGRKKVWTSWVV
ncbi:MAG: hypothetical protein ACRD5J_17475 [Nitrososphaeraceae archaeon]